MRVGLQQKIQCVTRPRRLRKQELPLPVALAPSLLAARHIRPSVLRKGPLPLTLAPCLPLAATLRKWQPLSRRAGSEAVEPSAPLLPASPYAPSALVRR